MTRVAESIFPVTTTTDDITNVNYPRIVNVYSSHDHILNHLFHLVNMNLEKRAAGCIALPSKAVHNVNVSDLVPSKHPRSCFGHSYEAFMDDICNRLGAFLDLPDYTRTIT